MAVVVCASFHHVRVRSYGTLWYGVRDDGSAKLGYVTK